MSSPKDSSEVQARVSAVLRGATPENDAEVALVREIERVKARGGLVETVSDFADPITSDDLEFHLDLDDAPKEKGFNRWAIDADRDGRVQDGTPFEHESSTLTRHSIGNRYKPRKPGGVRIREIYNTMNPVTPDVPPTPEEFSADALERLRARKKPKPKVQLRDLKKQHP